MNICELIKEKKIKLCTQQLESLKIRTASTQLVSERERERAGGETIVNNSPMRRTRLQLSKDYSRLTANLMIFINNINSHTH